MAANRRLTALSVVIDITSTVRKKAAAMNRSLPFSEYEFDLAERTDEETLLSMTRMPLDDVAPRDR